MNTIEIALALEIEEENEIAREAKQSSVRTTPYTLEDFQCEAMRVQFVVNAGGEWDETTSRMHCCDVIYRDPNYIQRTIRKWAGTIKEAYALAATAWEAEMRAGRAL